MLNLDDNLKKEIEKHINNLSDYEDNSILEYTENYKQFNAVKYYRNESRKILASSLKLHSNYIEYMKTFSLNDYYSLFYDVIKDISINFFTISRNSRFDKDLFYSKFSKVGSKKELFHYLTKGKKTSKKMKDDFNFVMDDMDYMKKKLYILDKGKISFIYQEYEDKLCLISFFVNIKDEQYLIYKNRYIAKQIERYKYKDDYDIIDGSYFCFLSDGQTKYLTSTEFNSIIYANSNTKKMVIIKDDFKIDNSEIVFLFNKNNFSTFFNYKLNEKKSTQSFDVLKRYYLIDNSIEVETIFFTTKEDDNPMKYSFCFIKQNNGKNVSLSQFPIDIIHFIKKDAHQNDLVYQLFNNTFKLSEQNKKEFKIFEYEEDIFNNQDKLDFIDKILAINTLC